jgi:uncharacterized protein DUF5010
MSGRLEARTGRYGTRNALRTAAGLVAATWLGAAGCLVPPSSDPPTTAVAKSHEDPPSDDPPSLFQLKTEWNGPCARSDIIDVNLGNTPEAFVRAAFCQIAGREPTTAILETWTDKLRHDSHVRRVDVVRALLAANKREAKLKYSDPWVGQPELSDPPNRRSTRDVGAVFMFFFSCPGGTNCAMDWANTHSPGMDSPSPLFAFGNSPSAAYSPSEPGFWRRELLDAKYAGLQFLMLNSYGPDIADGKLAPLAKALDSVNDPVRIALFDDTWTWGEPYFGDFWQQKPNLHDTEKAATTLYEAKWKPFFQQIDKRYWYRFKGRPFIYFYNSGTLEPRERSAAVLAMMKAKFQKDFGEEPFVDVDAAYFADQDMPRVADARFTWMPLNLGNKRSRSRLNGHIIDHAMVKWDAVGRDRPGDIAKPDDRIMKDPALLKRVLDESRDAEILVLATWNDLGEGTGINRNYDYYAGGRWLEPDVFMRLIRASQSLPSKQP